MRTPNERDHSRRAAAGLPFFEIVKRNQQLAQAVAPPHPAPTVTGSAVHRVKRKAAARELCAKAVKVARYTPEEWADLKAFGQRLYPRADGVPDAVAWAERPATFDESWRGAPDALTWRTWVRIAEQLRALEARRHKAGKGPTVSDAMARHNRMNRAKGLPATRSLRPTVADLERIMFGP
jgi:hypothetical protein